VIPDNAYSPHRGDCLISNPNEEYGYFPKNNDICLNLIPAVSNRCLEPYSTSEGSN